MRAAEDTTPGGRVLAAIAVGGGLGSVARHLAGQAWPAPPGHLPWATFTVNVTGCLALGALMVAVTEIRPPGGYARPFWGVGFLGGFTTFSTYGAEVRGLLAAGAVPQAALYAFGSLAAGVAAAAAGMAAARAARRIPGRRRR